MVVNDDAGNQTPSGDLESFASQLAPTMNRVPLWDRASPGRRSDDGGQKRRGASGFH